MRQNVVVLTGASGGVGSTLSRELRAAGYKVIPIDRKHGVDLTDYAAVRRKLNKIKNIDIIIHCAGVGAFNPINSPSFNSSEIVDMVNVNLLAPILITKHCISRLLNEPGKHIIFILSNSAYESFPNNSVY